MQTNSSWIDLRPITDLPDDCPLITEQERSAAMSMPRLRRRREWLMWRAVVREHLGEDTQIGYDAVGAPILIDRNGYIGVSHNREQVAVMYSENRCAVDIETLSRRFDKIASKYMTDAERLLDGAEHHLFPAAAWCAKEAVYKYSGRSHAGFLRDIAITGCDWQNMILKVRTPWQDDIAVSLRLYGQTLMAVIG